jgi:hypothetical protein
MLSDTHLFLNYDTTWDVNSLVSSVRLRVWEKGFEDSLEDLQTNGYECYGSLIVFFITRRKYLICV